MVHSDVVRGSTDDAWCGFPVQSDYVVALAGESGFAIMIGGADGPASITTSPASCYSSTLVLAADLNNDNHIGAHCINRLCPHEQTHMPHEFS